MELCKCGLHSTAALRAGPGAWGPAFLQLPVFRGMVTFDTGWHVTRVLAGSSFPPHGSPPAATWRTQSSSSWCGSPTCRDRHTLGPQPGHQSRTLAGQDGWPGSMNGWLD